ncbi:RNA polymerase factor sigma-54 [Victivallis sp. Marseille-Q1083]|uniref:RNA polymerase factor sigma-54 n=1 Tax=Victivallis sp. Marseille-Q1083 TaxID=2717288 RepID=UPI00158BDD9B|nr:RNA polymerase factor sigma-54 [Victivallis sp. Marseille-Q1083]
MAGNQLTQQQSLRQEQTLSPQQMQSLEFLIAPMLELQELVANELEQNPLVEAEKNPIEELSGDPLSVATEADIRHADRQAGEGDDDFSGTQLAEEWKDELPTYDSVNHDREQEQQQHDYWLNSLVEQPSLQDQLLEQLHLSDASGPLLRAAELAIGSVDDNGYLVTHPADIAMAAGCDLATVDRAIELLQSFDPPGIGARTLAECLQLQLRRRHIDNPRLDTLIEHHLDDIARNKLPQTAKAMNISLDELKALLEILKELDPHPGQALAPDYPVFVVPELEIALEHGKPVVHGHDYYLPKLRFSKTYLEMLENPETPPETRAYLKEKLLSAQNLLKNLEHRQSTLRRIAETLAVEQHDFFTRGIDCLRPLTMQQVADRLDLHETTISRAIANKYLKTPYGIFEFKFFFSGGYRNAEGEDVSSRSIKEKIRALVEAENPEKPLSDDKLSQQLKAAGVNVARRTVAKYREELGILPTHLRRQH